MFKRLSHRFDTNFPFRKARSSIFTSGQRHVERPVPQRPRHQYPSGIRGRVEAGKKAGGGKICYRVFHQLGARCEPIRANAR